MPANLFLRLIVGGFLLCTHQVNAADFKPTAQNSIVPKGAKVEFLWGEGEFTEGPTLGSDGGIYFSDIGNRTLKFDPRTKKTTVFRADSGKSNGLMMNRKGNLIACEGANGGNRRISLTTLKGKTTTLVDRWNGKRFNSPNDLAIDAKGRIYFTDPRYGDQADRDLDFEGVFLITGKKVKLVTKDISRPNGILVSLDGKKVFVADNHSDAKGNHHLVQFNVQKDGTLNDKKIMFDIGPGKRGIDGMTLDEEGNIYATAGKGERSGIYVFSPEGKHMAFIPTGETPTNCVFGGGKEKSTLYITARAPERSDGKGKWGLYRIVLRIKGHHIYE